jgi:hypothetical protein
MKYLIIILSIALFSCQGKKETNDADKVPTDTIDKPTVNTRLLILPGKCIGNIALEDNAGTLESILGKPDLSDSAMGKAWLTWFSKVSDTITGNELNVYTTYRDNELTEKVVRQIRITSDEFKTPDGLSTGKLLSDIQKTYPNLKSIGSYDSETPNPVTVYDAVDEGIAFEIEKGRCVGIIIHEKGRKVSEEYITFHPDMKPM